MQLLNLEALSQAKLIEEPYSHLIIPNFIQEFRLPQLLNEYPQVPGFGSYPCNTLKISSLFQELLDEMRSIELRTLIEEKFSINLTKRPVMMTARGACQPKDGRIHRDNRHKLITLLIYMNPSWDAQNGRLRILKNQHDLNDFASEIPPLAGTLVAFKVTKNSWHGHTPYEGPRNAIQVNYIDSNIILIKEALRHRFAIGLKNIKQKLL